MNEIRLQLALAKAGLASRRHAEELIVAGRVAVNGRVVTELGSKVDPVSDRVTVDGNPVLREAPAYYLMNKPKGYVTTAEDPEGRLTVFSLMKNSAVRLFSVGRLDYNTEGALLLTNDGELAHALMHPSRGVAKVYHAKFRGLIDKEQLALLRRGVDLPPARPLDKDGKPLPTMRGSDKPERSAPAQVSVINSTGRHSWLQFILHEGKNRQIHRMAEAVGSSLLKLLRVEYAGLSLMDLPVGEYRLLQTREVLELRQSVGLRPFAAQEGPQKPKLKPEPEEEPRAGGRRLRDESGERSVRSERPSSTRFAADRPSQGSSIRAPGGPRRSEWAPERPSARDGNNSRDRAAVGPAGRESAPVQPNSRERAAFGSADRSSGWVRSTRPAWTPERPSSHGEPRDLAAGASGRSSAPARSPKWSPERSSSGDAGGLRDRPAFGSSGRGGAPIRPRRPEWSQDRPSRPRDGEESHPRPAMGGAAIGSAAVRSGNSDRPSRREGSDQRERPSPTGQGGYPSRREGSDQRERPSPTGQGGYPSRREGSDQRERPSPTGQGGYPSRREGSDQRERPSPTGQGGYPPRPRRPEWSQDRPSRRDGSEPHDRPTPAASASPSGRPSLAPRAHRAPAARRPESPGELPQNWPPR